MMEQNTRLDKRQPKDVIKVIGKVPASSAWQPQACCIEASVGVHRWKLFRRLVGLLLRDPAAGLYRYGFFFSRPWVKVRAKCLMGAGKTLELNQLGNEFKTRSTRWHGEQVRAITRTQQRPNPSYDGQVNGIWSPPKQLHWNFCATAVDVIQGHHSDMDCSKDAKLMPPSWAELGAYLFVKKSKTRDRYGKDCGSRANATASDVESPGKKSWESGSGPQNPTRKTC